MRWFLLSVVVLPLTRTQKLLTDILPYSTSRSESNIMMCMMRGNLPAVLPSPILPRDVSGLLASCWKEPLQRPGALDFVRNFQDSQQLRSLQQPQRHMNIPNRIFFYGTLMEPAVIRRVINNEGLHLQVCPAVLYVSPAKSGKIDSIKVSFRQLDVVGTHPFSC
jgi:hypothetical protein